MSDKELKDKGGEHPFGDAGQLILFAVFILAWIVDSFFLHLTTQLASYVPLVPRLVVAGLILALGLYLMAVSHKIIEKIKRPDGVVSSGAFRYVRHPLYLAAILFYLGMTLTTLSLACVALCVVIFLFYNFIAGYEEKLLLARYGNDYRDYLKRVGRWLPRL